jgi:predicted nucleic acid-binding protein
VKYFFDTSVLVPVFLGEHPHHEASLAVFLRSDKKHGSCAAHSLAEVYATLTRLPGKHRASASEAMLFLENMQERLALIALDGEEYWKAVMNSAESGIVGGMIYDALLAQCALKVRAETIFTWNVEHFRRLGPEVAKSLRTP